MIKTEAVNEKEHFLVSRLKTLGKGELVALRRAFGSPLSEASGAALSVFYKICPKEEEKEEAAYLASCAIAYIMHYGYGKTPLSHCLKKAEVSESRIKALLNNKWVDKDGFFHSKYSRLVRYAVSKDWLPDINEIYPALTNWWKYRIAFIKDFYAQVKEEQ